MASISTPVLTIVGSPTVGESILTLAYEISFDVFDQAADQPYLEQFRLIGDDTGVPGDPVSAAPDDTLATGGTGGAVRASMIVAPATTLARSIPFELPNTWINEDQGDAPNPDEIRIAVTLTPRMPVAAGPVESNLVTVVL